MPCPPALSPKEAGSVQKDLGIYTNKMGGTLPKSGHWRLNAEPMKQATDWLNDY